MSTKPNILWITTDQQRADTLHALGNGAIRTPNLDRLCATGLAFRNAYCQSPICTPSRASFMTGLYPSRLPANINGNHKLNLPAGVRLISRILADAGYDCGLSGKLHLASAWGGVEERVDDGYRVFRYSHAPTQGMGMGNAYTDWLESQGRLDEVLDLSRFNEQLQVGAVYRENVPASLHQTTWCCDEALAFMGETRTGPWLMSINIFDPHPAYDAPRDYADRYDPASLPPPPFRESDLATQARLEASHPFGRATTPGTRCQEERASYYGMIELIDENVGRLLDALETSGQRENTVVIFTSDHGNLIGDHGLSHKGCRFYEGLVKVPLLISWPGHFGAGVVADGLVELADLAPTLAELAGAPLHATDGESLVPLLTGCAAPQHHRTHVRCEFYDTIDRDFGKPDRPPHRPCFATMVRDEQHKLCLYHDTDFGELYDLLNDPHEHDNLWGQPQAAALQARLAQTAAEVPVSVDPAERVGRF